MVEPEQMQDQDTNKTATENRI
ncbi:hypothetical protein LCGC14_2308160, partial [marine sediment metagenome]